MDSQYQLHSRLHQHSVILFLNELQWPREREYHSHRYERAQSMKAYTIDTLWTTMIIKISKAAVQITACWYRHPVCYRSSCVWYKHIKVFEFQVEHNKPWIVSWLYHSFLTPSSAFWATLRIPTILLYSHLGHKLHLICFDSMLVIFNSFSIYQLLSETKESRHLYKFPD